MAGWRDQYKLSLNSKLPSGSQTSNFYNCIIFSYYVRLSKIVNIDVELLIHRNILNKLVLNCNKTVSYINSIMDGCI